MLEILADNGTGRAFVVLFESGAYAAAARALFEALAGKTRALLCQSATVSDNNWQALSVSLESALAAAGIRQSSFISFGPASSLVQNLCLRDIKQVRGAVFIDASGRPHPTRTSRIIDAIESKLPIGLPFRSRLPGFDGRSFLQRIRCPVLVISSSRASSYQKEQAHMISRALPTSWYLELKSGEEALLTDKILEFAQLPAKRPMKNI